MTEHRIPAPKITIVLLPGLNGTSGLFDTFVDQAPNRFALRLITFPTDKVYGYKDLAGYVIKQLGAINGHFILIGESFSGPLSIIITQRQVQGLIGTILVASFIRAPLPKILRFLPWKILFIVSKPFYALKHVLSPSSLAYRVATELQKVSPNVLAQRIKAALTVDVEGELVDCTIPFAYFRGQYDFIVPKKNLIAIAAVKPEITVSVFNTHHFLLQSAPEKAWQAIEIFVNSVKK